MVKVRQRLGKYRVKRRLAQGGFADVFEAYDTVEGIKVALKVPHTHLLRDGALDEFKKEARLNALLDHPNILQIKNAGFIDNVFVIVYPLGKRTLGDRLAKRISFNQAILYSEQILEALSFAHQKKVIHCDVKPENLILFEDGRLRLGDFGIAKLALRTLSASGSGTVGYLAPEQAMGKPSLRSDVFSAGLIMYRMFSGKLPEWPYEWPMPGMDMLRRKAPKGLIDFLRRVLEVDERKRFKSATPMLTAFKRLKSGAKGNAKRKRRKNKTPSKRDWNSLRFKEFKRQHAGALDARIPCNKCSGPISEAMRICPWCRTKTKVRGPTRFPERCTRCKRGMKLDWRFCPYCYGGAEGPRSDRTFSDRQYTAKCSRKGCRKPLMPFMRYCPWCRAKIQRKWKIPKVSDRCPHCKWGVVREFWSNCPWCTKKLES